MVEIYSADWCDYCSKAKALMEDHGIPFEEHDMDDDEVIDELAERLPEPSTKIPQIFVDGEYVGGYDDLVVHLQEVQH